MRKQDTKRNRGTLRFCIHDCTFKMMKQMSREEKGRLLEHICRYVEEDAQRGKSCPSSPEGLTCEEEDNLGIRLVFNEWKGCYDHDKEENDRAFRNKSVAGRKGMQRRWHTTQPSSQEAGCTPAHNSSAAITEDNSVMTNTQEENNVIKKKKKDNSDTNNTTDDNNVITDDNNVMENITDDNTDKIEKIKKQIENINNNINNINIKKENSPKGELKKKNPSSPSPTPEERMNAFYESMVPYADQYDRDMLNDFYQYWTEMDRRRRRMRFEMQKTWETGKRLSLWARKSFRFYPIC